MAIYKSKFRSFAWWDLFDYVDNKQLITEAKDSNANLPKLSSFRANYLDGTSKIFDIIGDTSIYKHTILFDNNVIEIYTHYNNRYRTLADALYDYNDIIKLTYNGHRVVFFSTAPDLKVLRYVENTIKTVTIYNSTNYTGYIITKWG